MKSLTDDILYLSTGLRTVIVTSEILLVLKQWLKMTKSLRAHHCLYFTVASPFFIDNPRLLKHRVLYIIKSCHFLISAQPLLHGLLHFQKTTLPSPSSASHPRPQSLNLPPPESDCTTFPCRRRQVPIPCNPLRTLTNSTPTSCCGASTRTGRLRSAISASRISSTSSCS